MKRLFIIISVIFVSGLLTGNLSAQERYGIQDLQALEKSKSWSELFSHLEDVPPSKRDAEWRHVAINACLQEDYQQYYTEDWCGEQLKSFVDASPKDRELAWKSGKWSRKHRVNWFAVSFFDKAIVEEGDPRCKDVDVGVAVVSALGLPADSNKEVVQQGKDLAFGKCWSALKPLVKKEFREAGSYFRDNTCTDLKGKKELSSSELQQCAGS